MNERPRLKTVLEKRGLTYKEFFKISKVYPDILSPLCRGEYDRIYVYHLYKVCVALQISADFIIRRTDVPHKIRKESIIPDICKGQFTKNFGVNMKISEMIDMCDKSGKSIDEIFKFKYV